ncbi:hypothetical protein CYY_001325 [Polysphondylium violaceum]|uniref:ATP-dependent DNA helicase n=1 Tax=Polysphondylium violaceum TaxID=133409 RepID=A0A8J4Q3C8_9MYCE|nr:hypothetical protein CYY_001325 [Polysphondylium violaceum]
MSSGSSTGIGGNHLGSGHKRKKKVFTSSKVYKSTSITDFFGVNKKNDNDDNDDNSNSNSNRNIDNKRYRDSDDNSNSNSNSTRSSLGKKLQKLNYFDVDEEIESTTTTTTTTTNDLSGVHSSNGLSETIQINDSPVKQNSSIQIDDSPIKDNNTAAPISSPKSTTTAVSASTTTIVNSIKAIQLKSGTSMGSSPMTKPGLSSLSLKLPGSSLSSSNTFATPNNMNNNGKAGFKFGSLSSLSSLSSSSSSTTTITRKPARPTTAPTFTSRGLSIAEVEKQISTSLSPEQRDILQLVLEGNNVFFTGSAGTGKSFLLKEMVRILKLRFPDQVFLTASTGVAGCNIGGTTVHSFGSIGLGDKKPKDHIASILSNKNALMRWRSAKVLIIDEVSMISALLLDKLEEIARGVRGKDERFGGIQIVLSGDFCQLPPVSKTKGDASSLFCFKATCWPELIDYAVQLRKVFRQKDSSFINILNEIRFGKISNDALNRLNKCVANQLSVTDGIVPTILYPHRRSVEDENESRLKALAGESRVYDAQDTGQPNFLENSQAPASLTLKIGAQVILLKNLDFDLELVNGSRGVVVGWQETPGQDEPLPIVQFAKTQMAIGREVWRVELGHVVLASRTQIPLNLAWALSIHKGQGMSIDKLIIDLGGVFECGQTYVALSRATSLEGLQLKTSIKPNHLKVHQDVIEFYNNLT